MVNGIEERTLPPGAAARLQDLLDKQAIHEVLTNYCRALDRCDVELMKRVYWEDAVDAHGIFEGNAHAFAEFIVKGIQEWFEVATHAISNVHVELAGRYAYSEAYLFSYCRVAGTREKVEAVFGPEYAARQSYGAGAPPSHDFVMGGRYVDKLEKRGDEWRIAHRTVVHDWNQNFPSTSIWAGGIYGQLQLLGKRDRSDPVYRRD
jgi:ketosteroid isomerase-like protein